MNGEIVVHHEDVSEDGRSGDDGDDQSEWNGDDVHYGVQGETGENRLEEVGCEGCCEVCLKDGVRMDEGKVMGKATYDAVSKENIADPSEAS